MLIAAPLMKPVRRPTRAIHRDAGIVEISTNDGGTWTPEKVKAQLATGKSKQANFVKPVPVYIVYFTAAALNDGRINDYADLYGRDSKALAALKMKDGGAAKPKTAVAAKTASN